MKGQAAEIAARNLKDLVAKGVSEHGQLVSMRDQAAELLKRWRVQGFDPSKLNGEIEQINIRLGAPDRSKASKLWVKLIGANNNIKTEKYPNNFQFNIIIEGTSFDVFTAPKEVLSAGLFQLQPLAFTLTPPPWSRA